MFLVRTSIRPSGIHGLGVFVVEPVKKRQIVWQFDPRIDVLIPVEEKKNFPPAMQDYLSVLTYIQEFNNEKMMVLCADNAKHVNHSDNPNLVDTSDSLQEFAARDIAADEELACNYFASDLEAARKLDQT